jgi:hypothetical protein
MDLAAGEPTTVVTNEGLIAIEETGFAVDYFETCNARKLRRAEKSEEGPRRLLVAARIGLHSIQATGARNGGVAKQFAKTSAGHCQLLRSELRRPPNRLPYSSKRRR